MLVTLSPFYIHRYLNKQKCNQECNGDLNDTSLLPNLVQRYIEKYICTKNDNHRSLRMKNNPGLKDASGKKLVGGQDTCKGEFMIKKLYYSNLKLRFQQMP